MKLIRLLTLGLVALLCLTGCQTPPETAAPDQSAAQAESVPAPTESTPETPVYDVVIPTLPEGLSNDALKLVQLPDRQQYVYAGDPSLVLEVMAPASNETYAETEAAEAGGKPVSAYVFAEGDIGYPALTSAMLQGAARPAPGDQVLEWEAGDLFYRLFGAFDRDVLLAVAADIA